MTIIKYLVFAAFFLTLGPVILKLIFGEISLQKPRHRHHEFVLKGDKPVDPEDLNKIFVPVS